MIENLAHESGLIHIQHEVVIVMLVVAAGLAAVAIKMEAKNK